MLKINRSGALQNNRIETYAKSVKGLIRRFGALFIMHSFQIEEASEG